MVRRSPPWPSLVTVTSEHITLNGQATHRAAAEAFDGGPGPSSRKKKMKEPRNLDARDFLSQQFSLYDDASQKFKATFHEYKYTSDLDDVRSIE